MNMQSEPVAIANAVAAAIEAILVGAIAFGVDVTAEQLGAISAAIIAVGQAVATIFARRHAFAPSTVAEVAANVAAGRDAGLFDD